MSEGWNQTILIGNVGQNPYLGTTKGGEKYCRVQLCTSRKFKGKDGTFKKETEWHSLMIWGKMAEWAEADVKKGTKLVVKGRIHYNEYEKDGVKKTETQIIVEDMHVVSAGDKTGGETVTLHGDRPVGFDDDGSGIPF